MRNGILLVEPVLDVLTPVRLGNDLARNRCGKATTAFFRRSLLRMGEDLVESGS
jgi:hypothetical protein